MGKKKVILDTNILISAIGWDGNERLIFKKFLNKEFEVLISQKQFEEIKRVLDYPKLKFTEHQKSRFLTILSETAMVHNISITLNIIKEDPEDNMLLELAFETDADYIVSGDSHLLKVKRFMSTRIVTASEFLSLR